MDVNEGYLLIEVFEDCNGKISIPSTKLCNIAPAITIKLNVT